MPLSQADIDAVLARPARRVPLPATTPPLVLAVPRGAIAHEVVVTATELLLLGIPCAVEDESLPHYHSCDDMGCGQAHVLARTPLRAR